MINVVKIKVKKKDILDAVKLSISVIPGSCEKSIFSFLRAMLITISYRMNLIVSLPLSSTSFKGRGLRSAYCSGRVRSRYQALARQCFLLAFAIILRCVHSHCACVWGIPS